MAAEALSPRPNAMRYRLGRVAKLTGRDPRGLTDLLGLITASRLIAGRDGDDDSPSSVSTHR
jgi:sugar diacid utilization regulator